MVVLTPPQNMLSSLVPLTCAFFPFLAHSFFQLSQFVHQLLFPLSYFMVFLPELIHVFSSHVFLHLTWPFSFFKCSNCFLLCWPRCRLDSCLLGPPKRWRFPVSMLRMVPLFFEITLQSSFGPPGTISNLRPLSPQHLGTNSNTLMTSSLPLLAGHVAHLSSRDLAPLLLPWVMR